MKTIGSLFSGIGGWEFAARGRATPLWAVELMPYVAQAYVANHGPHVHVGSLLDVDVRELEPVDILVASPPCPDYSKALKESSREARDPMIRRLGLDILRYTEELRPSFVCVENAPQYISSDIGEELCDGLFRQGYLVRAEVLDAGDFGCPQRRQRGIIRASRQGSVPELPEESFLSWDDALAPVLDSLPAYPFKPGGWMESNLAQVPPGSYPVFVGGGNPPEYANPSGFRRVWTPAGEHCPTITRGPSSGGSRVMLSPTDVRGLTTEAFALLSGFLDEGTIVLPQNRRQGINILGNTIPPQLAGAALHGML